MKEQDFTHSEFRESRAPQDDIWTSAIESQFEERDRIKDMFSAPSVKHERKTKSFFARLLGLFG